MHFDTKACSTSSRSLMDGNASNHAHILCCSSDDDDGDDDDDDDDDDDGDDDDDDDDDDGDVDDSTAHWSARFRIVSPKPRSAANVCSSTNRCSRSDGAAIKAGNKADVST
jgi:hypothetical protein